MTQIMPQAERNNHRVQLRRFVAKLRVVTLEFLALAGLACSDGRTLYVVLIDRSASFAAAERTVAYASVDEVLRAARPGDRIVLAAIGTQNVVDFRTTLDHTLPRTAVRRNDRDARDSIAIEVRAALDTLLATSPSGSSNVLDAISASAELIRRDSRPTRHLVLVSDMRHETRELNFATQHVDSALIARIISERKATSLLPDLKGVRVHVAAAGGRADQPESYFTIRQFWLEYLAEAGARLDSGWYGRSAIPALR